MTDKTFDVIVIGGGPGGYVTAIRAGQLGLKTAIVEKRSRLGGTCLNVGCIPSKTLLHGSHLYHQIEHLAEGFGISCKDLSMDWSKLMARKDSVMEGLGKGIDGLMKKNKVTRFLGTGVLKGPNEVFVEGESGSELLNGKSNILATGSEAIAGPFGEFDEEKILSSTGALSLKKQPETLLVVGAGVIGLEMASVYARLGTKVTVVELMKTVLPGMDGAICKAAQQMLKKQGITFHLGTKVIKESVDVKGVTVSLEKGDKSEQMQADAVLVSIGRRPYSAGLGLENLGIAVSKGGQVEVDEHFRTSVPSIYAIGDLIDGPMLAHKASEEGVALAEHLAGKEAHVNYMAIPGVVYTWPEVANVGLSEEEAKEMGISVSCGKFIFKANSRSRCTGDDEGLVKIVADSATDRVLGMHIIGPNAGDMIHEGVLAIELKATAHDLARASHAHPTYAEAVKEAALDVHKSAIHM